MDLTKMSVEQLVMMAANDMELGIGVRAKDAIAELTRRIGEADTLRAAVSDLKRVLRNTQADAQYRVAALRAEVERLSMERDTFRSVMFKLSDIVYTLLGYEDPRAKRTGELVKNACSAVNGVRGPVRKSGPGPSIIKSLKGFRDLLAANTASGAGADPFAGGDGGEE